jgi:hypothetical protein
MCCAEAERWRYVRARRFNAVFDVFDFLIHRQDG